MSEETSLIIFFELVKDQFRFRKPKVRQTKNEIQVYIHCRETAEHQRQSQNCKLIHEEKKVITFMRGTIQLATNFCTKKMY